MTRSIAINAALGIALVSVVAASGCATKKFVQNKIHPVSQRIQTLETASNEHQQEIGELQTEVSRNGEAALTADQKAVQAAKAAEQARLRAENAGEAAAGAQRTADRANTGLSELDDRIDQLKNYKLTASESVLFNFASSKLTDDEQLKLDSLTMGLEDSGPYVIEVHGFTDTTGDPTYNLALSKKRAETVVRYLTLDSNIPLHRIYTIGLGSENPASDNSTREGRKLNRRVELRVFVADQPEMTTAQVQ